MQLGRLFLGGEGGNSSHTLAICVDTCGMSWAHHKKCSISIVAVLHHGEQV